MTGDSPHWADEITAFVTAEGPVPFEKLAERANVSRSVLRTFLDEHPYLCPDSGGDWVSGLRLADGVAFLHELSAAEVAAGVLAADDDLALWARFAQDGLPLAGGGQVGATTFLDLPAGFGNGLPPGRGGIGQVLTGPDGWLTEFSPGDVLSVRLRDGGLEISAAEVPEETGRARQVRDFMLLAATEAMRIYLEEDRESPIAPFDELLVSLLRSDPELLADPLPPLARMLRGAGMETFGGSVGVPGVPWDLSRVRGLRREEVVAGAMAVGMLVLWAEEDPEHAPTLLRDYLTATPGVIGYVADEVEVRAAEGARFGEQLAKLGAIAKTPAERAAVTLLLARSAEGSGDSAEAERLVHEALAAQPALVPALADAGEYAACRGELHAADDYLRRSGLVPADSLRRAMRNLLVPPRTKTGRNHPCPCGSGRKHKLCCLNNAVHPITERAKLLYALLATYVQRAPARETLSLLISRSGADDASVFLCLDLLLTDCGFAERFLRARGGWLRADERELAESWLDVPIGLYEVVQVRKGTGVTVRPMPDGEPVFLPDRKFSGSVRRLDLFCGRLLPDGERPRVLALPTLVPRDQRAELAGLLAGEHSAEQLAEFFGPRPEPYVRNGDGHEYVDAEAVLKVTGGGRAWARLADRMVEIDIDVLEWHREVGGKVVSAGQVTDEGDHWVVRANSVERLTELERMVREVAPDAVEVRRKAERLGGGPHPRARELIVESYVVRDAGQALPRAQAESWIDAVPGSGLSPREAARAGGRALADLETQLDDMEWHNDRSVQAGNGVLMDVDWIRQELGLQRQRDSPSR
ncbi:SEC-C metal-binding domain-containing protein [Nonomuraea sp. MCN248]|uniref:SEC-C metal-binding domain-containing protein n=1 Tax=Nonomuraea corallina TaxID=2989783 RepID=A0ABT4S804_9ACTN|nr:SEC-C metal-binding domain-containing protein [Nonomuraea corallina]MDA0633287.1 SEC-C metal-binding domain-containing protein [Nonomuraea corallina]